MMLRLLRESATLCVSAGESTSVNALVDEVASGVMEVAVSVSTSASSDIAALIVVIDSVSTASFVSCIADVSLLDDAAPVCVQHRLIYCSSLGHFSRM